MGNFDIWCTVGYCTHFHYKNIHQVDAGLDCNVPMTPQMQVPFFKEGNILPSPLPYTHTHTHVVINITITIKLQAAKMTSLDVFGFDPTAADSDDEPITDVEDWATLHIRVNCKLSKNLGIHLFVSNLCRSTFWPFVSFINAPHPVKTVWEQNIYHLPSYFQCLREREEESSYLWSVESNKESFCGKMFFSSKLYFSSSPSWTHWCQDKQRWVFQSKYFLDATYFI